MKTPNLIITGEDIVIIRNTKGRYKDGHYEEGVKTFKFKCKALVEPISGKDILKLKEGDRIKENLIFTSTFKFEMSDLILHKNKKYKVQHTENWPNHSRAIGVIKDNEETI